MGRNNLLSRIQASTLVEKLEHVSCGGGPLQGSSVRRYALFRGARFLRNEPLRNKAYGSLLERPPVDFTGSSFSGGMDFTGASFGGGVSFNLVDCTVATFKTARFLRKTRS